MMQVKSYVVVVVYRYPSKTNPIIVNVYGHPTEAKARSQQLRIRREAKKERIDPERIIAVRVRPILEEAP